MFLFLKFIKRNACNGGIRISFQLYFKAEVRLKLYIKKLYLSSMYSTQNFEKVRPKFAVLTQTLIKIALLNCRRHFTTKQDYTCL
jgi:hypothetical protein